MPKNRSSAAGRNRSVRTCDSLRRRLLSLYDGSTVKWRDVAAMPEFGGVAAGTLCSISKGYEPKSLHVRLALGLPAYMSTPVCPRCGVVHVRKTCPPAQPSARRKPTNWKRLYQFVMAAWAAKRPSAPTRRPTA